MKIDLKSGDRIISNVQPDEEGIFWIQRDNFNAVIQYSIAFGVVVVNQICGVKHLFQPVGITGHCEFTN